MVDPVSTTVYWASVVRITNTISSLETVAAQERSLNTPSPKWNLFIVSIL